MLKRYTFIVCEIIMFLCCWIHSFICSIYSSAVFIITFLIRVASPFFSPSPWMSLCGVYSLLRVLFFIWISVIYSDCCPYEVSIVFPTVYFGFYLQFRDAGLWCWIFQKWVNIFRDVSRKNKIKIYIYIHVFLR